MSTSDLRELRLKAVLTEYRSLRSEGMKNMEMRARVTMIMVSASGIVGAIAIPYKNPFAFAIIPFLALVWAEIIHHSYSVHVKLERYLREHIEGRKIPSLIDRYSDPPNQEGWIHWSSQETPAPALLLVVFAVWSAYAVGVLGPWLLYGDLVVVRPILLALVYVVQAVLIFRIVIKFYKLSIL